MPCLLTPRNYFGLLSLVTESHSQSYIIAKYSPKHQIHLTLISHFQTMKILRNQHPTGKTQKLPEERRRRKAIKRGRRGEKDAEARKSLYNQTQYGQYCCRKDFLATKGTNNLVMVAIMVLAFYFKYYSDMVSYMP